MVALSDQPSSLQADPAPSPPPAHLAFLHTLLATNFDLAALAKTLPPDQLIALTTDPQLLKHLHDLLAFSSTCLALRHAQARAVALTELTHVLSAIDDPVEKRRAATALLRATNQARTPRPSGPDASRGEGLAAGDRDHAAQSRGQTPRHPAPKPTVLPTPDLTPDQVITHIRGALRACDDPEPDSGLATIAAFASPDLTVNDKPIPIDPDEPHEAIDALADSDLAICFSPGATPFPYRGATILPDNLTATATILYGRRSQRPADLDISLSRTTPQSPWLIAAFRITPRPP